MKPEKVKIFVTVTQFFLAKKLKFGHIQTKNMVNAMLKNITLKLFFKDT